jgi:outer membrane protein TolC
MKAIIFFFIGIAGVASAVHGEELEHLQADPQLTLAAVVEATYARSPKQSVIQAVSGLVQAREIQANSLLPGAPAVVARHQNDTIGSNRNQTEWEAGLEIPLWLPGQRAARSAVAQEFRSGLDADCKGLKLLLAGQVRDAVWDVAMNSNSVTLAELRLKTAQALQTDVEKRWKAGELARTDTLLAQNETLQAQTALLRAAAELKHAEHRYWMLTGLKHIPQRAEEPLAAQAEIDDAHPLLADFAARVGIARGERQLVQVERRENPQVTVSARHDRGAFDQEFNNSIGLSVRIPLDSEVRSAPLIASAEMALGEAISRHGQQLLNLQAALHEAEHNLEVTREELSIIEAQHRLAQENLRLARKAFALGESDLVALLRVQAQAYEAEKTLTNRRTQLQWEIATYNQAVGVLP